MFSNRKRKVSVTKLQIKHLPWVAVLFAFEFDFVNSRVSLIPSEISVKIMLATLSNNMAPKTYTAKITEERKPPMYFAYSPRLVKILCFGCDITILRSVKK